MSTTVDERVVEMRFDNKQFETNVQTSLSTLAKLKQSLNLSAASKGLESIGAAAKNVNLGAIGDAAEVVQAKFSALQIMGMTAISRLTDSAITAGKRIASAFTIEPIRTGFEEYETQINAVQTILANTSHQGTTLGDVNAALDELNRYADKTIYNFTQMTRNVGTFTAAGLDLQTSVEAIKGIANLAAVSGSTSQQASTAMYQLSQALANGRVTLQDWNSVVNAGMGGKVFQDALVRTAAAMEGISEEAFRAQNIVGSFRESISTQNGSGWLTSEVLSQTLRQFTGDLKDAELATMGFTEAQIRSIQAMGVTANDAATKVKTYTQLMDTLKEAAQSGWTQTWELVVGDFEEAKSLWTGVSDILSGIINNSAEARNTMLAGALESNWEKMIHQITDAGISVDIFEEKVKDVMSSYGPDVDRLITKHGSLEKVFKNGAASTKILEKAIKELSGGMYDLSSIERELKKGFSGDDVKQLQSALNGLGFDVGKSGVDGVFGQDTLAALKAFQEANGLDVSGILDESTIKALSDASSTTKDLASSCGELISNITELGGRELLINTLRNAFDGLMSVVTPIKTAFREIFPPATSEQVFNIIQSLNNFSKRLIVSGETADKIKRTFKGLFAILDIGKQAIGALWNTIKPLIGGLASLSGGILDTTASWGDWLVGLNNTIRETNTFGNAISGLVSFIQNGFGKAKDFIGSISESFKSFVESVKGKINMPGFELFHSLLERMHVRMGQVGETANSLKDNMVSAMKAMVESIGGNPIIQMLQSIWKCITNIAKAISGVLSGAIDYVSDKIANINFSGLFDMIAGLSIGGIALSLKNFIDSFSKITIGDGGILSSLNEIKDGIVGTFEAIQSQLKAEVLLKIASAIAILSASVLVLSLIDSDKLAKSLGAITGLFADLMVSLGIFGKISGNLGNTAKACSAMISMSVAIAILAGAMKSLSSLSLSELSSGILGIVALGAVLVGVAKIMSSETKTVMKGTTSLIVFATAMKILASACSDLGKLPFEQLLKGLVSVGALFAVTTAFLNKAKFGNKVISTSIGILVLSAAMKVLASACKDFTSLSWGELALGLTGVGALLLELAAFTKLVGSPKHAISTGIGLIAVAAAMKIFASAVSDFAKIPMEQMLQGLIGIGVALAEVAIAVNVMPKNMIGIGAGLLVVGTSLLIVANAVQKLGTMSPEELTKGLVGLGVALGELALGLNLMKGTISGAAALLVASAALAVLTPVLSILGAMPTLNIVKGLLTLAGAMAVIGLAGLVISPIIPAILGLATAMTLISLSVVGLGLGLIGVGAGLSAIAVGITALAASGAAGATALVASLSVIITGIAGLIPKVAKKVGEGIIEVVKVIIEGAPLISQAIVTVLSSVLQAIIEVAPLVVNTVLILLDSVLSALVTYLPTISQAVFDILLTCLRTIANNISMVVQAAIDVVLGFIDGITQSLPKVIQAGFDLLLSFINGVSEAIANNGPLLVEAMSNLILSLVDVAISVLTGGIGLFWDIGAKIVTAIGDGIASLWDWFTNTSIGGLITDGITAIKNKLWEWKTAGSNLIVNLIDGVKKKFQDMKTAASNLLTTAKEGITNKFNEWKTAGKDLIAGFTNGIKEKAGDVVAAAKGVVSDAIQAAKNLLGIASPSKEFAKIGRWSDEGLVVGLKHYAGRVANAAKDVAGTALNTMDAAMSSIVDIVDFGVDSEPTIRPVLDLTAVENGAYVLNGLFADPRSLALGADVSIGFGDRTNALASMISDISDGENVVNAIRELRSDVAELAVAMTNMRVVMDTGATVGALEGEIDKRLGIRSGLKGRGN